MNYREHMKKGECLLCAILWTVTPALHLFFFLYSGIHSYLDLKSIWCFILLLAMDGTALIVHWYRYLTYDKKVVEDE